MDHSNPDWQSTYRWSREVTSVPPVDPSSAATPPSEYVREKSPRTSGRRWKRRKGKGKDNQKKVGRPSHQFEVDDSAQASSSRAPGGNPGSHHPRRQHARNGGHSSSNRRRTSGNSEGCRCVVM